MRRNSAERRQVLPDPRYNNVVVAKFINNVMERGKKSIASSIVYDALVIIEEKTKRPGIEVFEEAMKNATPQIEVKPRRVGGATYQIPMEPSPERKQALAMRWLSATRSGRSCLRGLFGRRRRSIPQFSRLPSGSPQTARC